MGIVRITQGAAWEQGVLDNVVAAEHGLTLPGPVVEYERDSLAYHPETGEEIPADTPIFVKFAEGKKGSLMCEGTENYFNSADLRPENCAVEVIDRYNFRSAGDVEGVGNFSWSSGWLRLSGTQTYPTVILEEGYYTLSFTAELLQQGPYTPQIRLNLRGSDFHDGGLQIFNLSSTPTRFSYSLYVPEEKAPSTFLLAMNSNYVEFTNVQIEKKAYDTPFHPGTRAAPLKRITLPEPLPEEFGVGVSFKPLHDFGTGIPRRSLLDLRTDANNRLLYTLWNTPDKRYLFIWYQAGGVTFVSNLLAYEFPDSIKDQIIGLYAHSDGVSIKTYLKIGAGEPFLANERTTGDYIRNTKDIYVGSWYNGTQAANAILADFVLHTRPADIDPIGYLSAVPGGGGE